jgi:hypothetical protein
MLSITASYWAPEEIGLTFDLDSGSSFMAVLKSNSGYMVWISSKDFCCLL